MNFDYSYSIPKKALRTRALLELAWSKPQRETYNSCLLNLYHDGNEGMSWHSDAEKVLKKNGAIASMSLEPT
jgi:alkylated DNA repair dioxygenase AlkB